MAVTTEQLEQLYLAYFGRPADFEGVAFYASDDSSATIDQVASTFAASAESQALYGTTLGTAFVNAIYQNLFNRDADVEGLLFWTKAIANGVVSPGGAALAILQGATDVDAKDLTMITNKVKAATAFTAALNTAQEIMGYAGQDAAALARQQLHTVTADTATLTAYLDNVDALVAAVVGVGGTIGETVTLTTGADTVNFAGNITTIDTVKGVIDNALPPPFSASTYSVGDSITGNGKTIVDLAVVTPGVAPFATVKNVAQINITNAAGAGTVAFDGTSWSNVGSVNLNRGTNGLTVKVANLNAGAAISVANVNGQVIATYTNDMKAGAIVTAGVGSIGNAGNSILGTVGKNGNVQYIQGFSSTAASSSAMTVGDVTVSGSGGTAAAVTIGNLADEGADITVGNVTMSGAVSSSFLVKNASHTTSGDAAPNTTVGNITLSTAGPSGTIAASVINTGSVAVGNLTVGNVSLSNTGKNGNTHFLASNMSNVAGGDAAAGDLTVGSVSLTATGATAADVSAVVHNYAYATGTHSATVGNTTVGDTTVTLSGKAAGMQSLTYSVSAAVDSGDAVVGNVQYGGLAGNVGQASQYNAYEYAFARANAAGGTATIGNVLAGDQLWTVQLDATVYTEVDVYATGNGAAGTIGAVNIGNTTATVGVNAQFTSTHTIEARGDADSSIGDINIGNAAVTGDDGAKVGLYNWIFSDGTVSKVTVGTQSVTLGVSASATITTSITAAAGTGAVSIGDVSIDAHKQNSAFDGRLFVSATSATSDIASVTVGNISLKSGDQAAANTNDLTIRVQGAGTVGDVSVGTVTLEAVGKNANAGLLIAETGGAGPGKLGNLSVGNVSLVAQGTGAYANLSVAMSSAAKGGTVTVGNISATLGAAKATAQTVSVTVDNSVGAVKIGDINITGASRGSTDTTMLYDFNLNVNASTTATIGNITVSGGDKASSAGLADFAGGIMAGVTAGTSVTIGNVDYSGFKAAATIDVHTFKGAASITGSAFDDVITDNKGTNTLTGGAGADTFTFVTTNTGKTAATADVITDFNAAQGDKIASGAGLLTVAEYGENTFADFATFLTGANAADKKVFVGAVGSDAFVAVDFDNSGTVDYVIKLVGVNLAGIDVSSFV